jgi:ACS family glucarate transporter-like MFS transporter
MAESHGGKLRWLLVGWMFALSAVAYMDRVNMAIAGKDIATQFHLSNVQLGYVFSAFLVGYALFQVPNGRLADSWGPRKILTLGVVWWGVFVTLMGLVPKGMPEALLLFMLLQFLLGTGEAVVYPACNRTVATWIPVSERGIANGIIFAGVGFGAGITPPLITWILIHWGWRSAFFTLATIGLAVGLVWYWISRDDPQQHPWISQNESDWIVSGLDEPVKKERLRWGTALASRDVLALTFSYFTYGYSAYIFFSWFFLYLVNVRGLNLKTSAYYSMLPFFAMTAGSLIGGAISDVTTRRMGRRFGRGGIAMLGMLLAAVFIAFGGHVQRAGLASMVLAGGAGALYLSQSSFWSATADVGGHYAGSVSGIMNMGNQIGGAITASLTPLIANRFGWNASFGVAAVLCVLGAIAWLLVDPGRSLFVARQEGTFASLTPSSHSAGSASRGVIQGTK